MDNETRRLEQLLAQQASQWVEILRDPSVQQRAAFIAWLKESPRNVRDFLLMLTVDQALDGIDARHAHDIQELVAQASGRIVDFPVSPVRRRVAGAAPRRWKAATLAASAAAVALLVGLLWNRQASQWTQFETAAGEQRAFELEDGSVIHLNTGSHAAIRFSAHARDVRLMKGEALFRVHHDAQRPFSVFTRDAVIQAVGTQFDVYERRDGTEVSVIEGRVNVRAAPDAEPPALAADAAAAGRAPRNTRAPTGLIVHSSEGVKINRFGDVSPPAAVDVAEAVAWRERRLIFREQRLDVIAEQFNRYSRKQIRLEGSQLGSLLYTGVFDADDVESLAQILARDPQLAVESTEQAVIVKAR